MIRSKAMAMNRNRGRRLAWLALLALVASLLATTPGSAQAQDDEHDSASDTAPDTQDLGPDDTSGSADGDTPTPEPPEPEPPEPLADPCHDPIDDPPTFTRAERDPTQPLTQIILEWEWVCSWGPEDPDLAIFDYELQVSADGGDNWIPDRDVDGSGNTVPSMPLGSGPRNMTLEGHLTHRTQAGNTFHYRVRVITDNQNVGGSVGPWATAGPVSTESLPALATPTGFTAVPSPTDPQNIVLLSWEGVPDADEHVHYHIKMSSPDLGRSERSGTQRTTFEHVVDPDFFWEYELWAVRDYGHVGSVESGVAEATVMPNQPPVPTGLAASAAGTNAVNISWNRVPKEAGSVPNYELQFRSGDSESGEWERVPSNYFSYRAGYTHRDRPAGSTWEYQVRAVREGAWNTHEVLSEWSETVTVTTDADIGGL